MSRKHRSHSRLVPKSSKLVENCQNKVLSLQETVQASNNCQNTPKLLNATMNTEASTFQRKSNFTSFKTTKIHQFNQFPPKNLLQNPLKKVKEEL
jgi:uncharacterized protein YoxC